MNFHFPHVIHGYYLKRVCYACPATKRKAMEQLRALDKTARTPSARNKRKSCWEATALGRPTASGRPTISGRPTPGDFASQIDCSQSNLQHPDDRQTPDVRRLPWPRTADATGRLNDQHPSRNYECPTSPDVRTVLKLRTTDVLRTSDACAFARVLGRRHLPFHSPVTIYTPPPPPSYG